MNSKEQMMLDLARAEAATVETWADLSNFLFDADDGLISKAYPVGPERKAFMQSPEYAAIRDLISEVRQRTGVVEGATPRKNGKFMVLLPCSMRATLETEAKRSGVSVDQLVVAKLTAPAATGLTP